MANSFAFMIPLTQETKSKSRVSFKLDITSAKCKVIESFVMDYEFAANSAKARGRGVTFSRALLKDGNLLSRPQPEAVLAPVSYRLSRRRRQRKRLLLKVPIKITTPLRCLPSWLKSKQQSSLRSVTQNLKAVGEQDVANSRPNDV